VLHGCSLPDPLERSYGQISSYSLAGSLFQVLATLLLR
jgi:hypothetical protein